MALLRRAHGVRALGLLVGAAIALTPLLVLAARSVPHTDGAGQSTGNPLPETVSPSGLVERSGVRIEHLAATGGGGLLDLRYQVIDPGKAVAVHDPETPPAIIHERTGVVIENLLMDHAHSGQFKAGLTYYLIFHNPGQIVRPGDRVSVVLGDARVEHLRVR
jgi:hypothetical protein